MNVEAIKAVQEIVDQHVIIDNLRKNINKIQSSTDNVQQNALEKLTNGVKRLPDSTLHDLLFNPKKTGMLKTQEFNALRPTLKKARNSRPKMLAKDLDALSAGIFQKGFADLKMDATPEEYSNAISFMTNASLKERLQTALKTEHPELQHKTSSNWAGSVRRTPSPTLTHHHSITSTASSRGRENSTGSLHSSFSSEVSLGSSHSLNTSDRPPNTQRPPSNPSVLSPPSKNDSPHPHLKASHVQPRWVAVYK